MREKPTLIDINNIPLFLGKVPPLVENKEYEIAEGYNEGLSDMDTYWKEKIKGAKLEEVYLTYECFHVKDGCCNTCYSKNKVMAKDVSEALKTLLLKDGE